MKPYGTIVGHLLRLCRVILIVQVVIVAAAGPACAGGKAAPKSGAVSVARPAVDLPTRKAFTHFYSMEYDQAIRDFEQVVQSHPEDPSAVNHLASAVLYKELYRIGALDTELFANDGFLDSRHFPVDPAVRQRVRELTERSIRLSDERLKANPDDVVALYARGVARGTRAVATGMLDKSWFAALRSAVGARRDHERVLSLEPGNTDAKMIVGVHNYVLGSLSWAVKAAASVIGLGGSKQKGIQYLYEAANGGGETSVDARIALSLFLRREQRYPEAIALVGGLVQAYPRNFLVALELANLLNAAGQGPQAIAAYRKLLSNARQGVYNDPRLEQAAYGLAEALRGQQDYPAAAEAYDMVISYSGVDPELQGRASLAAGQMYDVLQNRERATRRYEAVIAIDKSSPHAGAARRYLKKPYRTGKDG